jgi:hypothetical protein
MRVFNNGSPVPKLNQKGKTGFQREGAKAQSFFFKRKLRASASVRQE